MSTYRPPRCRRQVYLHEPLRRRTRGPGAVVFAAFSPVMTRIAPSVRDVEPLALDVSPGANSTAFVGLQGRGGVGFTRLFNELFPDHVRVAEMPVHAAEPEALSVAERAQIRGAINKRQREYAAVRQLAHPLLKVCGARAEPLLNGFDRAPLWPIGIVGCLSHCTDRAVATVALSERLFALGCDVEPARPLPNEVISEVLLPDEAARLTHGPRWLGRLMFSAKETYYKAQYPATHRFLDFDAVEIMPDVNNGVFTVQILQGSSPFPTGRCIQGRFAVRDGYLGTALSIDAE